MTLAPLRLVVEDRPSEALILAILRQSDAPLVHAETLGRSGSGYIRRNIHSLNAAAKGMATFVLTDLDSLPCPRFLRDSWLPHPHPNLIFRIAVREVESWVLADRSAFAELLRIDISKLPCNPDTLPDPKQTLVNLARRSPRREIRLALTPRPRSTAVVGPEYNDVVCDFVDSKWNLKRASAADGSASLRRALQRLQDFMPVD